MMTGKGLNLNKIAEVIAMESNGFISTDLHDALRMADEAGLGIEPLNPWILSDNRKLNYGEDGKGLSLEADITLTLKAKAGDQSAMDCLFTAHAGILHKSARQLCSTHEMDSDDALSIVNTAYATCINNTSIYSKDKVYKSTTQSILDNEIARTERKYGGSSYCLSADETAMLSCNIVRSKLSKENITTMDITIEMIRDFLPDYFKTSVKGIYNMLTCTVEGEHSYSDDEGKELNDVQNKKMLNAGVIASNAVEDAAISRLDPSVVMQAIQKHASEKCVAVLVDFYVNELTYAEIQKKYEIEGIARNRIEPLLRKAKKLIMNTMYDLDKKETTLIAKERTGKIKQHTTRKTA